MINVVLFFQLDTIDSLFPSDQNNNYMIYIYIHDRSWFTGRGGNSQFQKGKVLGKQSF